MHALVGGGSYALGQSAWAASWLDKAQLSSLGLGTSLPEVRQQGYYHKEAVAGAQFRAQSSYKARSVGIKKCRNALQNQQVLEQLLKKQKKIHSSTALLLQQFYHY